MPLFGAGPPEKSSAAGRQQSSGLSWSLDAAYDALVDTRKINLLNIGLMLVALATAVLLPFRLFLVAYAVLGPLHYLTQISWLHNRRYFTSSRKDSIPLVLLAALVASGSPFVLGPYALQSLSPAYGAIVFAAFALALVLVVTEKTGTRLVGATLVFMVATSLPGSRFGNVAFALMLPTLVHVLVFTGLFILLGALRERSPTGTASFVVFIGCAVMCLVIDPGIRVEVGDAVRSSYPLADLNFRIVEFLRLAPVEPGARAGSLQYPFANLESVFSHPASWRATRLIAFAYTYHYLNWFSKTRVIGWHEISRRRMATIVTIWIVSVAIYAYDFITGLAWLFLLSLAHVFLEFPLNWRSIGGIVKAIAGKPSPSSTRSNTATADAGPK